LRTKRRSNMRVFLSNPPSSLSALAMNQVVEAPLAGTSCGHLSDLKSLLVDGADYVLDVEHLNRALDAAPVTEVQHVAEAAAAIGSDCRLELRMLAEIGNQVVRAGKRGTVGDMNGMPHEIPPRCLVSRIS